MKHDDVTSPSPTSVILPTVAWTDACEEVADQLRPADELLVVYDDADDPIADQTVSTENVRFVGAGKPTGCSGRANAIAAGMEAARHDRLVWTDDDFRHPPDWLTRLHAAHADHRPTAELPVFAGRDPLAVLLEPVYTLGGILGTYLGDHAWGGAVVFERDDLNEAAFLSELRRTVGDDGLLGDHLDVTAVRRTHTVPIGGSVRGTLERHVRFNRIVAAHDPTEATVSFVAVLCLSAGCLLVPALTAVVTASTVGVRVHVAFGVRRPSAVWAVPALVASVPLGVYAFVRDTFVWGGRHYRWRSKFDVEVVDD
jgi:hypothetical protein